MEKEKTSRRKLTQACNSCRRKKTKCDGIKPDCGKCQRLNETCSYDSVSYKKSTKQITQLKLRLNNIEKAIQSLSTTKTVPTQTLTQTERHSLLCTTAIPNYDDTEMPISLPHHNLDNNAFPSLEIILELVDIYFTHLHIITPVLHKATFIKSVIQKTCSPFILYSMMAVAARFSKRPEVLEEPVWMSGEKYAIKAREMIGDVVEKPSLDHIQGFLLLCCHEYGCDQGHRCWMYGGIASRMASQIELGTELMYNIKPGTVFSIREWMDFETRRKVYWITYINDKFSSVCTGKPFFLEHSECNLLLPTGFRSIPEHNFSQESVDRSTIVHYHLHRDESRQVIGIEYKLSDSRITEPGFDNVMIQGAILMSKIIRFLPRFKGVDTEFIQINQQLDDWFNQLPPMLKETQANLERCKHDLNFTTNYVMVHTVYKSLIVLLNRPLLSMPKDEISQATTSYFYTFLNKCISATNGVAMLLNGLYDKIEHVPPLASYLTYIVGTVAISNSFSPDIYESQKADMARQIYLHFLGKMKVYWGTVDKLYSMMIELYNMNKNLLQASLSGPISTCNNNNNTDADHSISIDQDNTHSIFDTIDEFTLNGTPSSTFYFNDWLIE
ncbi:hypothetical protein K501DRAFT_235395 [Backusella circina FSU 941]|nr:hypothetical protein K501DRAFT_235395 [Backusella circina FSU 941]